jgi:hypothetical protein
MISENIRLIPESESSDGDYPAAKNARSKQQLYEKIIKYPTRDI